MERNQPKSGSNPVTKDEVWRAGDEMFYRKMSTDSDYCIQKFKCKSAGY